MIRGSMVMTNIICSLCKIQKAVLERIPLSLKMMHITRTTCTRYIECSAVRATCIMPYWSTQLAQISYRAVYSDNP